MVEFYNTFYGTLAQYVLCIVILLVLALINAWVGHRRHPIKEMTFQRRFWEEAGCNVSIFIIAVLLYSWLS